jgi:hypothetical protein
MAAGIFVLFMITFTGFGVCLGYAMRVRQETREDVEYQGWLRAEAIADRPRPRPRMPEPKART